MSGLRSGRPILVVDPSCASVHGHHLKSLQDLLAAIAPKSATVLVNASLPRPAFGDEAALDVHRAFTTTVYDEPGLGPRPNARLERRLWKLKKAALAAGNSARFAIARARAAVASSQPALAAAVEDWDWARWREKWPELESALRLAGTAPVAHIVAPSADVELISGLVDSRQVIEHLRGAQIHARLITPTAALARLTLPASASPTLRSRHTGRMTGVHLYVETAAMQRYVRATHGLESEVYPYLLAPPAFDAATQGCEPARAAFGYFGAKRNEKGFKRLLPILTAVAAGRRADDPALSFFIHASDATSEEGDALQRSFDALAGSGLAIEVVTGALSEAEYARRFAAIDATLLPYTGARYALSGSGIVCEALALGKAIVMSKGLSFADICHPDTAIEADGDEAFGAAILAMARDISRYRTAAAARAVTYGAEVRACALLRRLAPQRRRGD